MKEIINLYAREGDNQIAVIELWYDLPPSKPEVGALFLERWTQLVDSGELNDYSGLVLDSTTGLKQAFFYNEMYRVNKNAKEPRQWYAGAAANLRLVLTPIAQIALPVVVITHITPETEADTNGVLRYLPNLPGQLARDANGLFGECYHSQAWYTAGVGIQSSWTAVPQKKYPGFSQIGMPPTFEPNMRAVIKAAREVGNPNPHAMVIGEPGSGKSTGAATMITSKLTKPVLVLMFDPRDKATPYFKRGVMK
jgi:hypothetical protein